MGIRTLVVVLGDQLDAKSLALEDFDANQDLVWMAELPQESEHVWSHKARTALFFSAMRQATSGKYIQRMSNYCEHCPYDPNEATGELACPFTTLYWNFLMRHEAQFNNHPRATLQWRNLGRLDEETRAPIRKRAEVLRHQFASSSA
jgi:deoxyribodipyrimidine photolyase-like uncharacterized protein